MTKSKPDMLSSKEQLYRAVLVDIRHRLRSDPPNFETAVGELRSVYDAANMVLMENGDGFMTPSETVNVGSFPKLEFAEHCGCCVRNKITLEVFGTQSAEHDCEWNRLTEAKDAPR